MGVRRCAAPHAGPRPASSLRPCDHRPMQYETVRVGIHRKASGPWTCTSVAHTRNPQGPRGRTGVSVQYAAVSVVAPFATSPSIVGSPRVVHEYLLFQISASRAPGPGGVRARFSVLSVRYFRVLYVTTSQISLPPHFSVFAARLLVRLYCTLASMLASSAWFL